MGLGRKVLLSLCALPAAVGLRVIKSAAADRPQRIGNYSFASLRLCEKKIINLAKPPSRKASGRQGEKSFSPWSPTCGKQAIEFLRHFFPFASLRLCEKKIINLAKPQSRKASGSQELRLREKKISDAADAQSLRKAGRKVPKAFECLPRTAAENQ